MFALLNLAPAPGRPNRKVQLRSGFLVGQREFFNHIKYRHIPVQLDDALHLTLLGGDRKDLIQAWHRITPVPAPEVFTTAFHLYALVVISSFLDIFGSKRSRVPFNSACEPVPWRHSQNERQSSEHNEFKRSRCAIENDRLNCGGQVRKHHNEIPHDDDDRIQPRENPHRPMSPVERSTLVFVAVAFHNVDEAPKDRSFLTPNVHENAGGKDIDDNSRDRGYPVPPREKIVERGGDAVDH
mmetsp:Transcript_34002/g.133306  ORF Transcript_34002/g.133306 Transcript_34002/m.133306 type:complete len:240 (-) Transcript_34002:1086-1805(-)